jgi:hypothetical protein
MKVLFLSTGIGLALATRLSQEGHEVKVFIHNDYSDTGEGLYERVGAWKPYVNRSDLVLADDPFFGYKEFRFENAPTRTLGISRLFTYASRSINNRRSILELTEMPLGVGDGMYSVEAWWNGRKWCTPFILSTYHKQLISQQVGPNVGAMVTVSKTLEDVPKPIFEGFRKLKPLFEKGSYRGPVRLDFDHANALTDIYAGFTFDNTEAMLEGVQEPPIDVLLEIAGGTRSDLNLIQGHYIAVRFQHIGWPTTKDFRIYGLVDANLKHCGLNSVLIRNGHHYCSQKFGPILKVTARGDTAKDAFARASRTITNLDIENICYRADLLEKYSKVKYPAIDKILDTWKDTKTTSQK